MSERCIAQFAKTVSTLDICRTHHQPQLTFLEYLLNVNPHGLVVGISNKNMWENTTLVF